ncbi:MAG: gluconate 2-dehydrogenase subunit 3 family protein [Acidimicrobiales bacterium]
MGVWLDEIEYEVLETACEELVPGAAAAGVADYIDTLLGAFTFDPPRIFAGGPFSGRAGGEGAFDRFTPLSALQELAWRIRIEGSAGLPAREFNGPVQGWQQLYSKGIAALGADFSTCDHGERIRRLRSDAEFTALLYEHCCQGMYGAPEYGGNRDSIGWRAIGFTGDVQPRGWTDDEVEGR